MDNNEKNKVKESKKDISPVVRLLASWIVLMGAVLFGAAFFVFSVYHTWFGDGENWVIVVMKEHFAATIGLPFGAVASLFIVTLLRISSGQKLEFEAFGFKFRGASGPVVLWLACFLGIAVAIKLLW